jgi:ribosomal-protein-serine acetyltransferase
VGERPNATLAEVPDPLGRDAFEVRRWRPGDAPLLHRAVLESLEHLRPWMPWIAEEPLTLAQRRELIARWVADGERGGDLVVGVFAGAAVAGGAGLHHRIGPGGLEIGYWTHPAYLRRGVATTAARLLTDAAFSVAGIERVEIHHDRANTRSAGVPRRLGFELTAEAPDTPAAPADSGIDCTWTMTRGRWESRRS